jgi:predicted acyl esterase
MKKFNVMAAMIAMAGFLSAQTRQYPNYPSETPAKFVPSTNSFDYTRREEMIPMRDGVKLHTVILVPRGARSAPILLTRTPYNAKELTSHAESPHLGRFLKAMTMPSK